MTSEAWTVLAVVVGALLGGVAQVIAGSIDGVRQRRRERDDHKRQAYVDFIDGIDAEISALLVAQIRIRTQGDEARDGAAREYQEAGLARMRAGNRLTLYAPTEVQEAALLLTNNVSVLMKDFDLAKAIPLQRELAAVMRKDLGIAGSVYGYETVRALASNITGVGGGPSPTPQP